MAKSKPKKDVKPIHTRNNPRHPITLSPVTDATVKRVADLLRREPHEKPSISLAIREIILEWEEQVGSKGKSKIPGYRS